jgi:hypothetical protein
MDSLLRLQYSLKATVEAIEDAKNALVTQIQDVSRKLGHSKGCYNLANPLRVLASGAKYWRRCAKNTSRILRAVCCSWGS